MRHLIIAVAILAIFTLVYNSRCGRSVATFANPVLVGSKGYEDQPWHTPGGAIYSMSGGKPFPQYGDMMDAPADGLYINDVDYREGTVPILDSDPSDGHRGRTTTRDALPTDALPTDAQAAAQAATPAVEHFWYDMNTLGDGSDISKEYDDLVSAETKYQRDFHRQHPPLTTAQKAAVVQAAATVEGFSHNRAPVGWNETDYPVVTSNGLDLTPLFPQSATIPPIGYDVLATLWGANIDDITK